MIFKRYLMKAPWRPLFIGVITLSTLLSLVQLVLIYQLNQRIGIPNLAFAVLPFPLRFHILIIMIRTEDEMSRNVW